MEAADNREDDNLQVDTHHGVAANGKEIQGSEIQKTTDAEHELGD